VIVDDGGRVHVAQRGTERPILVFNPDGSLAGHWGEGVVAEPHYMIRAADGRVMIADRDAHQILCFDAQRRLGRRIFRERRRRRDVALAEHGSRRRLLAQRSE
jgi:hypothetical protein